MADAPILNHAAVVLGRLGGHARAGKLTQAERIASARKAAKARWKGHKPKKRKGLPAAEKK